MSTSASKFIFEMLPPWQEITERGAETVADLKRELRRDHVLYGVQAEAWARRIDCNDVLFRIFGRNEQFAVVHLTPSGERDPNKAWPSTFLFFDAEAWRIDRMVPDHQDYTG